MSDKTLYARHSPITDPGALGDRLELTGPVADLVRVVHGLFLHPLWARHHGVTITALRQADLQLRSVTAMLARLFELDDRPLTVSRPPDRKLIGNCRDQSVFLCALLRQQGIPARARCGFSLYLNPGRFEDHWVCEYWDGRWVMVDPQLDQLQCRTLGLTFDPLDLPAGRFIDAARAWQLCRQGETDPGLFGIHDLAGLWFVRGNLIRDLAALNRVEVLPWDAWGLISGDDVSEDDLRLLDRVAAAVINQDPALYRLYADDRLRCPNRD